MANAKDCSVHGFRASFRTWCGETTEFPRELAELSLAHAFGSDVERSYSRGDLLERRRPLMEQWATFCTGIAELRRFAVYCYRTAM
jgi:hypothetical protein